MDKEMIDVYFMTHHNYFPSEKIGFLKEKLLALPADKAKYVTMTELKEPTTLLLISLFLGTLGVDRFMLGDIGMGVLKLLTGGCCGVLTIVDWCTIMKKTREKNFDKIWNAISMSN